MPPDQLPRNIRRHGSGFRAVIGRSGRVGRSQTFDTIEKAERWRDDYLATQAGAGPALTFKGALDALQRELRLSGARPATFGIYAGAHRSLMTFWRPSDFVGGITRRKVEEFIDARLQRVSASTVRRHDIPLLRRYLKFARRLGQLRGDPFDGLILPRFRRPRFDAIPEEEVAALLAAMRAFGNTDRQRRIANRDADLYEFLMLTGLRRSELVRLRVRDFDLANGRLFVEGKTDNTYVALPAALRPLVDRLLSRADAQGRLVPGIAFIDEIAKRWKKRTGDRRVKAHVLRHSFATALAPIVPPFVLRDLLRHATLTQSARYVHAQSGLAERAVADLAQRLRQPPPAGVDDPAPPTSAS